ncbi:hypothetical protein ACFQZ4_53595 [Catellatospora coxensis]
MRSHSAPRSRAFSPSTRSTSAGSNAQPAGSRTLRSATVALGLFDEGT